ncbi:hypothetical protein [Alicyclobacillus macrosporangiidus]|uniref:hypothetical protein n=1 Tax=Alicyclobacillus macrosporangiidus TaxID=392015 RepID=UPI001FE6AABE|nr:hypothetical protein [Alicyclobacillus macrosporangiidus]
MSSAFGWYFVPLASTIGPNEAIAGLSVNGDRLELLIRTDSVDDNGNVTFSKVWHRAWFDPETATLTKEPDTPARSQQTYDGSVSLQFPMTFPDHFQPQTVAVEIDGKPAAKWPDAIPMYGSAANPSGSTPGDLDNRILGQVGDWIWVALKGPQYPPLYPNQGPLLWGFRRWDRLVAFDVRTGDAVQYAIPASYSRYVWMVSSGADLVVPTFARDGDHVWVAVGEWIGCFPADPMVSAGAGTVTQGGSPVLHGPEDAYVRSQAQQMMAELSAKQREIADCLASYWDTAVGAHVPGIPSFDAYSAGQRAAWNLETVIYNHGVLPPDLVWAMEFPLPEDDPLVRQRTMIERTVLSLVQSPLNLDAMGVVTKPPQAVVQEFHGKPPVTLPGYEIRNNAYWPKG